MYIKYNTVLREAGGVKREQWNRLNEWWHEISGVTVVDNDGGGGGDVIASHLNGGADNGHPSFKVQFSVKEVSERQVCE